MPGTLRDKVAIVTGAGGSIGRATAELFLSEGAKVLLVDRDAAKLEEAHIACRKLGEAEACAADVADAAATQRYVGIAAEKWGGIDVVFANAGLPGVIRPVTDYPEDAFDAVMAVNVRGPFLACKYALPKMRDGGSIVVNSSVVGVTSDPGIGAYAVSKHAVIGLVRTVAKEAAPRRIRVNAICPGPIDNSFQLGIERGISAVIGRDATKMLDSLIPLKRHGQAAEIARAVLFLASDQSSFTTGSVLMADGGMSI